MRERRAFRGAVGGGHAVIAAEDAGLYRDAFGVMPPGGFPEAFLEPVDDALERVLLRYARSHGPFTTRDVALALRPRGRARRGRARAARGARPPRAGRAPARRSRARVVRSRRPSPHPPRVARRPAPSGRAGRAGRARPLPPRPGTGSTDGPRCARRSSRSRASRSPSALWETEILPRRVPGYQPASLDQLCASGEVVWVGAGLDRVALFYREDAAVLGPPTTAEPLGGPAHDAVRAALARSAEFWPDLRRRHRDRPRGGSPGPVGARLGRRGHERRVGAAAGEAPLRRPRHGAPPSSVLPLARLGRGRHRRALVAHRAPLRRERRRLTGRAAGKSRLVTCPRRARAGGAPARAAGDRDA